MRERYRVLLVATHPIQYAAPLFRQMAKHPKLDVQVAYCSLQGAEAGFDHEFGVKVKWDVPLLEGYPWVHVPNRSPWPRIGRFLGLINPGLWKLVRTGGYDALVAYTGYMHASFWIVAAAAKLQGISMLFATDATAHAPRCGARWKVWVKKVVLPVVYRVATVVLPGSAAGAEYLRSLGIPAERIVISPNVADNEYWSKRAAEVDRAVARSALGCADGEPMVLFCAKLQPWKRPQDVLRAFAKANVPGARLVIAGDGPMRAELEAEAKTLNVAERVRFAGFLNQSEMPALYRSADIMVLPSEYDPCPFVVCEAMLCGCPVILSDRIRGRRELVRSGDTGFFYPCGDVGALGETLRRALTDRHGLKQMSEAARARMNTFSPREYLEANIQALERAALLRQGRAWL